MTNRRVARSIYAVARVGIETIVPQAAGAGLVAIFGLPYHARLQLDACFAVFVVL